MIKILKKFFQLYIRIYFSSFIFKQNYKLRSLNFKQNSLDKQEIKIAIQRLTALWAFAESGLGGALHALQLPFTGLIVGGMAMIILTLIATISQNIFQDIFKALCIVVVIKLSIAPYTPVTAYIAVLFQAFLACIVYSILNINLISILLFSIVAMLESALQKILLLLFFYGNNLIDATNSFINFVLKQFSINQVNGSFWILLFYVIIYFIGGIFIATLTYKIITNPLQQQIKFQFNTTTLSKINSTKKRKGYLLFFILAIVITLILFFLNYDNKVIHQLISSLALSLVIISFWYFILTPIVANILIKYLKSKQFKYEKDISTVLLFFPFLHQLVIYAWQESSNYKGLKRIFNFSNLLIHVTLFHHNTSTTQ